MKSATPSESTRYVIPVVRNTFQIIGELAQNGNLTLNDAARRTGIPKSTVFRILATLLHLGVAIRDSEQKTYRLGRVLGELTREGGTRETLRRIALPYMLKLRGVFGETVNLGELQHDMVVYVEVVPSEYALKLSERPGATVWALSTALGRSVLAFSPPGLVESLMRGRELPALTPFTITDPAKLAREFEKVRSQGYAIECEESALQATCIGVPILNRDGRAIAALSISGPMHRFRPAQDDSIATSLLEAARGIEREFRA
ncbi:MAG: IclR family transcriptional regulator [Bryobacteraceae bacterium]